VTVSKDLPADGVAAYESLHGACKAATHLVEIGFDEHEVAIAPRDFDKVESHELAVRLRIGACYGSALGAAVVAVAALVVRVGIADLARAVVWIGVAGALVGCAVGVAAAIVRHAYVRRYRFGASASGLAPRYYEVVVATDSDRANHQLAKWWDADAPPARSRVSA
jgi:hypothetical protein